MTVHSLALSVRAWMQQALGGPRAELVPRNLKKIREELGELETAIAGQGGTVAEEGAGTIVATIGTMLSAGLQPWEIAEAVEMELRKLQERVLFGVNQVARDRARGIG